MSVARLKLIVTENKAKHDKIYADAVAGFWVRAKQELEAKLEDLKNHHYGNLCVSLVFPENHNDDYQRAIEMLDLTVDKEVILKQHEFESLVRNRWPWRQSFLLSNAGYLGIGTTNPNSTSGLHGTSGTPEIDF